MIENISRYIEEGDPPLRGGAEGLRADRLHHHLADRLADRGADPAAVHGRRGRPPVPRIRDHARGDDPDLGRRVADAGADDCAPSCCSPNAKRTRTRFAALEPRRRSTRSIASYGRMLNWVLDRQPLTLLVARRDAGADRRISTSSIPKGFFPVQDTGVIQGDLRGAAVGLLRGDGGAAAGARRASS